MFVDGSNQRTTRPGIYQQYFYNGHKRCHCVKWQGLMLPNGIMPFPFGPINGHRHDSHMLSRSYLVRILRRMSTAAGQAFCVYGDPAYPQSDWVCGPHRELVCSKHESGASGSEIGVACDFEPALRARSASGSRSSARKCRAAESDFGVKLTLREV